jgi:hypothetical protein
MDRSVYWLRAAWHDLLAFLPDLLLGVAILLVGYVLARVLAAITRPLLHRVGFDRLIARLGIEERAQATGQGARWGASFVFWVTMLVAVMSAADAWRLEAVEAGVSAILAYVPHLVGAAVIFGAALFFGNFVRDRILDGPATGDVSQRPLVAGSIRAGILALGAFMALRELQIAPQIVTLAFSLTLGAIALAAALAFGLGSRDVAGRVARRWVDKRMPAGGAGEKVSGSQIVEP